MRKSRSIGKFAAIVILLIFVVNVTVLVHDVIASVYVRAVTNTGTEIETTWDFWGFQLNTYVAFAEAEAYPTATWDATPGIYSGYASVSATVGNAPPERDSGLLWIRVLEDAPVEPSKGFYVKATGDEDASTSASASGHLYEN